MPRLETPGLEPREGQAADAISSLASDIERLVYHQSAQGIAPTTVHELQRCFRVLKRACVFYFGENHGLVYDCDTKFKPKAKAANVQTD